MNKRTESQLLSATLRYLQTAQNLGEIAYHKRLHCGAVKIGDRFMRLGHAGASDLMIILKDGSMLWAEAKKSTKEKLRPEQLDFCKLVSRLPGHRYIVFTEVSDVEAFINKQKEGLSYGH